MPNSLTELEIGLEEPLVVRVSSKDDMDLARYGRAIWHRDIERDSCMEPAFQQTGRLPWKKQCYLAVPPGMWRGTCASSQRSSLRLFRGRGW